MAGAGPPSAVLLRRTGGGAAIWLAPGKPASRHAATTMNWTKQRASVLERASPLALLATTGRIEGARGLAQSKTCRPCARFMGRKQPIQYGQISRLVLRRYFLTVNGTEKPVFSHIIFSKPPPDGFGSMAIVNWSTVLSSVSFFRSIRASSFVASLCSL